ncbi:MAG: ankyrin repeat domain-containing protein [Oligoflexia bacterium]|nr:ankyrin repeat domain-containing protein [Oligoflexia bacterium]
MNLFSLFFLLLSMVVIQVSTTTTATAASASAAAAASENQAKLKLTREISHLEVAVMENDFDRVKKLAIPKDINPKNTEQGFPLIYAVFNDHLQIAEYLLQKGAKVDAKMKDGITPIYLAVTRNQVSMVELLLKYKANVNQDVKGTTLSDYAKIAKYTEIHNILIKAGASDRVVLEIPPLKSIDSVSKSPSSPASSNSVNSPKSPIVIKSLKNINSPKTASPPVSPK